MWGQALYTCCYLCISSFPLNPSLFLSSPFSPSPSPHLCFPSLHASFLYLPLCPPRFVFPPNVNHFSHPIANLTSPSLWKCSLPFICTCFVLHIFLEGWGDYIMFDAKIIFLGWQDGRTALLFASGNGRLPVVQLLLQKDADLSLCKKVWSVTHCVCLLWSSTVPSVWPSTSGQYMLCAGSNSVGPGYCTVTWSCVYINRVCHRVCRSLCFYHWHSQTPNDIVNCMKTVCNFLA